MNGRQLRDESQKLRTNATSRQQQAGRFEVNAQQYDKDGDETRSAVEAQQATKLNEEAANMQQQADDLDRQVVALEGKVAELENQKKQLTEEFEKRIAEIEKQQEQLSGVSRSIL